MQSVKELLAASRGERPCDLLIRGGCVANVLSMEYESADIAVHDGVIVGVGGGYEGRESPAGMGDHDGIAITCFLNYSRSKYENEQD